VPLNPSNEQSGRCFPGEVKLCGVHAGKDVVAGVPVHATPAARVETRRHRSTRIGEILSQSELVCWRRQGAYRVATVAAR